MRKRWVEAGKTLTCRLEWRAFALLRKHQSGSGLHEKSHCGRAADVRKEDDVLTVRVVQLSFFHTSESNLVVPPYLRPSCLSRCADERSVWSGDNGESLENETERGSRLMFALLVSSLWPLVANIRQSREDVWNDMVALRGRL